MHNYKYLEIPILITGSIVRKTDTCINFIAVNPAQSLFFSALSNKLKGLSDD